MPLSRYISARRKRETEKRVKGPRENNRAKVRKSKSAVASGDSTLRFEKSANRKSNEVSASKSGTA